MYLSKSEIIIVCWYVYIVESPTVTSPTNSDTFTTNERTDITFRCNATGSPLPIISFFYDGTELTRDQGRPASMEDLLMNRVMLDSPVPLLNPVTGLYEVSRTLTLFNAVDGDSGAFVCSATADIPGSGMRADSVMFNLTVFGTLLIFCDSIIIL